MPFLMKGKTWEEHKHKLVYPVIAEVKHDEIRVHVQCREGVVKFLSYAGKPLYNLEQYADDFKAFFHAHPGIADLDMGVQVNECFEDTYRWVRSKNGVPAELVDSNVVFYLFDVPGPSIYAARHRSIAELIKQFNGVAIVKAVDYEFCNNEAEVLAYYTRMREHGYEGVMVKTLTHLYHSVPARTDGWLKLKPENDADGCISELHEARSLDGVPLGRIGSITVLLEDGSTAVPAGIPHELGRLMFQNPTEYLCQWVQFKYMERDRAGGYRHPSFVRFREAKQ